MNRLSGPTQFYTAPVANQAEICNLSYSCHCMHRDAYEAPANRALNPIALARSLLKDLHDPELMQALYRMLFRAGKPHKQLDSTVLL